MNKAVISVRTRHSGFTIIELSVVLLVIALILGTSLSLGASQAEVQRISQTNLKLSSIQTNFQSYLMGGGTVVVNGLPCPADPSLIQTSANFGVAVASVVGSPPSSSTCTVAGAVQHIGTGNATGNAYVGALPNRTLLLPDEYQVDGWGNKFAYVMNAAYNNSTNLANLNNPYPAITVNSTGGGICVLSSNMPVSPCLTNDAAITIISYGHSSYGAWTRKGAARIATGYNTDTDQKQNVVCDATYITSNCISTATSPATFVAKSGTSTYDQITRYMARWQLVYSPIAGGRVNNSLPDCNRPLPAATNTDPTINSGTYYLYQCGTNYGANPPGYIPPNHCVPTPYLNNAGTTGLFNYNSSTTTITTDAYKIAADMNSGGGVTPYYTCVAPDGNFVFCNSDGGTLVPGGSFDGSHTYTGFVYNPLPTLGNCWWWQY